MAISKQEGSHSENKRRSSLQKSSSQGSIRSKGSIRDEAAEESKDASPFSQSSRRDSQPPPLRIPLNTIQEEEVKNENSSDLNQSGHLMRVSDDKI